MTLAQARKQTQQHPLQVLGWKSLGVHLIEIKPEEALQAFTRAHQLAPDDPVILWLLSRTEKILGNEKNAMVLIERALTLKPDYAQGQAHIAEMLYKQSRYIEALKHIEIAESLNPENSEILAIKGNILYKQYRHEDAIRIQEKLIKRHPKNYSLLNNLGNIKRDTGLFDDADTYYQKAIELAKDDAIPFSNRLTTLHYRPDYSRDAIFEVCKEWQRRFGPALRGPRPTPKNLKKDRRIKIGMVSDGFRSHPVGWMITSALENLEKSDVELYAYSTNTASDNLTKRIQAATDSWMSIQHLSDEALAQQIQNDAIDVLIDLCGHNTGNRMQVMAMEPAPIILKWVGGLINTTGAEAFDYLLSDGVETPPNDDAFYTEKLIRLPDDYICFTPPSYQPRVGSLPAIHNGYITLGCFNNPIKINEMLLGEWAKLMHQLPNSRLFLKGHQYDSEQFCQRIRETLAHHGITQDRLILEGPSNHDKLLEAYNRVDIALDPWPYSGGLTTCEAMLMGVPVVTLPGPTFAGRHSATHLVNAGMPELVVNSWDEYRKRVTGLANDLDSLATIRSHLRDILLQSPVCDSPRFARHFSTAMRAIWHRYCEGKAPAALAINEQGEAWFEGEEVAVKIQRPSVDIEPNKENFSFAFKGKIVVVDNGGQLVTNPAYVNLHKLGTFSTVVFDPAGIVNNVSYLQQQGEFHHLPQATLGDGAQATLYHCLSPTMSATLEPLPTEQQIPDITQDAQVIARLPIATHRLDAIDGLENVDWLVLNNMNDSLKILENGNKILKNILLIQAGISFLPTHHQQPELKDINQWIKEHEFDFYRLNNLQYHSPAQRLRNGNVPEATQLATADAIFIPSKKRLNELSENQITKLAFLLHVAYGIQDLTYSLISQIDISKAEEYARSWIQPAKQVFIPHTIYEPTDLVQGAPKAVDVQAAENDNRAGFSPSQLQTFKVQNVEPVLQAQPSSNATVTKKAVPSLLIAPSEPASHKRPNVKLTEKRPFVSVVVPSYNRASDLRRCLYSILAIDCDELEVIVSDNASPDNTQDILAEFTDPRIRAYRQSENIGAELNMAFVLEKATGDWVITLSDDDRLMPQAVGVIRESMRLAPNVGFILSPLRQFNAAGELVQDHLVIPLQNQKPERHNFRTFAAGPETLCSLFWHGHIFSRWILRRDVIDLEGYKKQIGRHLYSPMWITSKALLNCPTVYTTTHVVTHQVFNKIHWNYPDDYMYGGIISMIKELLPAQRQYVEKMLEIAANRALTQVPFVLSHGKNHLERYVQALMKLPEFTGSKNFAERLTAQLRAVRVDEKIVRMVLTSKHASKI